MPIFGDGSDNIIIGTGGADYIYALGGDDDITSGDGNDAIYAGDGNDVLDAGEGNDRLDGGAGADFMRGGNGNDTYVVDNVGDEIYEAVNGGFDSVQAYISFGLRGNLERLDLMGTADIDGSGSEIANSIRGNSGNNSLAGRDGNDSINGGSGNDIINGGQGNDYMIGGDGIDMVTYLDSLNGVRVDLSITGNQNTVIGSLSANLNSGVDFIQGFENLEGSNFDDILTGDSSNNQIKGLSGDDVIRGGAGDDELVGGAGADQFVFEAATINGVDTIRNFEAGVDKLVFSASDYSSSASLTLGSSAVGLGAQFVYDASLDALFYDADGTGGAAQVHIAELLPDASLSLSDFVIS